MAKDRIFHWPWSESEDVVVQYGPQEFGGPMPDEERPSHPRWASARDPNPRVVDQDLVAAAQELMNQEVAQQAPPPRRCPWVHEQPHGSIPELTLANAGTGLYFEYRGGKLRIIMKMAVSEVGRSIDIGKSGSSHRAFVKAVERLSTSMKEHHRPRTDSIFNYMVDFQVNRIMAMGRALSKYRNRARILLLQPELLMQAEASGQLPRTITAIFKQWTHRNELDPDKQMELAVAIAAVVDEPQSNRVIELDDRSYTHFLTKDPVTARLLLPAPPVSREDGNPGWPHHAGSCPGCGAGPDFERLAPGIWYLVTVCPNILTKHLHAEDLGDTSDTGCDACGYGSDDTDDGHRSCGCMCHKGDSTMRRVLKDRFRRKVLNIPRHPGVWKKDPWGTIIGLPIVDVILQNNDAPAARNNEDDRALGPRVQSDANYWDRAESAALRLAGVHDPALEHAIQIAEETAASTVREAQASAGHSAAQSGLEEASRSTDPRQQHRSGIKRKCDSTEAMRLRIASMSKEDIRAEMKAAGFTLKHYTSSRYDLVNTYVDLVEHRASMYTAPELFESSGEEPESEVPAGNERVHGTPIYDHARHDASDLRIQNTGLHWCAGQLYGRILLGMPQDQGVGLLYTRELTYGNWFLSRYELDGMKDNLLKLELGWTNDNIAAVDVHIRALRKALKLVVPPPITLNFEDEKGPSEDSDSPRASSSNQEHSGPDADELEALAEQEFDQAFDQEMNLPEFYDPSEHGSG